MVSQCSLMGNQSTPIVLKMWGLTRAVRAESFIQSASLSAKLMGQSSQQTPSCMFSVACRQPDLSQSAKKRSLKSEWSSYYSLFFSLLKNSTSVWLIRCLCMFKSIKTPIVLLKGHVHTFYGLLFSFDLFYCSQFFKCGQYQIQVCIGHSPNLTRMRKRTITRRHTHAVIWN